MGEEGLVFALKNREEWDNHEKQRTKLEGS